MRGLNLEEISTRRGGPPHYLSCDWGTSSFRLRLVIDGRVIKDFQAEAGCRSLFERAGTASRSAPFEEHLRSALESFRAAGEKLAPLHLIISGMASSSIGWKELPYAAAPMMLDGTTLRVEPVEWNQPRWLGKTYLVSGVAAENDMMRGEETEAIGLMNQLPSIPANATLLLPGTHSKHLRIANGAMVEIKTYMTGELYEVLARHSILRSFVASEERAEATGFREGIHTARERGLGAALFQARVRHVLHKKSPAENAAFLSGVLIGAELADLLSDDRRGQIFVGGAVHLRDLYTRTFGELGINCVESFSDGQIQQAVPVAHRLLLARLST